MATAPTPVAVFICGTVKAWNLAEKKVVYSLDQHRSVVLCLAVNLDGSLLDTLSQRVEKELTQKLFQLSAEEAATSEAPAAEPAGDAEDVKG